MGTVAADKGYDDGANHELLRVKGVHSAIRLNEYRTQKKDKNYDYRQYSTHNHIESGQNGVRGKPPITDCPSLRKVVVSGDI